MSTAPKIPKALRTLMAEIGPRWATATTEHIKLMVDAFTPVLAMAPKDDVNVTRSLAYGLHASQVLDVYVPQRPLSTSSSAMLIFCHGGAFVDGEKDKTPEFYGNILYFFARHGVVGINMEYRHAPEFKYPSGAQDVGDAVAWTKVNATKYGGDPNRIFIMGHSAGAAHTGCYAYDANLQPPGGSGVAGHIVVSGRVRTEMSIDNPNAKKVEAYCGSDPESLARSSATSYINASSIPTFIAFAEFENPLIDLHCLELAFRLATFQRRAPPMLRLRGHNHTSIVAHFNTAEDILGQEILQFISTTPPIPKTMA